jgi:hypothetical protein
MFKIQPEAVKLFHFIREWMAAQHFTELKGYTVTLLVVFYLQRRSLMPPVELLQRGAQKEFVAGISIKNNFNLL